MLARLVGANVEWNIPGCSPEWPVGDPGEGQNGAMDPSPRMPFPIACRSGKGMWPAGWPAGVAWHPSPPRARQRLDLQCRLLPLPGGPRDLTWLLQACFCPQRPLHLLPGPLRAHSREVIFSELWGGLRSAGQLSDCWSPVGDPPVKTVRAACLLWPPSLPVLPPASPTVTTVVRMVMRLCRGGDDLMLLLLVMSQC